MFIDAHQPESHFGATFSRSWGASTRGLRKAIALCGAALIWVSANAAALPSPASPKPNVSTSKISPIAGTTPQANGKFALLVGINKYRLSPLRGCVADAEQMSASLKRNFGFQAQGLTILRDGEATRNNILEAFRRRLIEPARLYKLTHPASSATVVFYFSGHGQRVPDRSGDESRRDVVDAWDESICPVDCEDPLRNTDRNILDDEFDSLLSEISAYTSSVTFIYDSCASGTMTRGMGPAEARAKELPPASISGVSAPVNAPDSTMLANVASFEARARGWAAFSACRPWETAMDTDFETGRYSGPHGVFTHYLLGVMDRATNSSTNGEVWSEARIGVASCSRAWQRPVLEGDATALFLGGGVRRGELPLPYSVEGNEIRVANGVDAGARRHGLLEVRPAGFGGDGSRDPIVLTITRTDQRDAFAAISIDADVGKEGSVRLVTPFFGVQKVRTRIDLPPGDPLGEFLKEKVRSGTLVSPLIELTGDLTHADVAIKVAPRNTMEPGNADTAPVYYVAHNGRALFGDLFETTQGGDFREMAVARRLQESIENFAHQQNLRTLQNANSTVLLRQVVAQFIQIPGTVTKNQGVLALQNQPGGREKTLSFSNSIVRLPEYSAFCVQLTSRSPKPLYAAIAVLGTSGAIKLLPLSTNPDNNVLELPAGGSVRSGTLVTTPPGGVDEYKVIIATTPQNFSLVERQAGNYKGDVQADTALEQMFVALSGMAPRSLPASKRRESTETWAVLDLCMEVVPSHPAHND